MTKSADPNPVEPNVPANQVTSETGAIIVGRVIYHGAIPLPTQEQVTRDVEACGSIVNVEPLSVDPSSHGVRDAIVHVGIEQYRKIIDDLSVAIVKNHRCRFYPRVAAILAGAQAEISNNDPVMHNTNMTLNSRMVLNVALVAGGNPIQKTIKMQGLHLIKCNVHKFMQAYRYVFVHQFFDQTNETGQFKITGLPPGPHALSVWHETLGVLHKEIQVPARGTVTIDFEFK